MSRTIFGVVFASGLALAVGCGSKAEPTLPNVSLDGEPTPPVAPGPADPAAGAPKAEPPKAVAWEIDPDKHTIPATAVRGTIGGVEVTPIAELMVGELRFHVLKPGTETIERSVRINLAPMLIEGQPLPPVLSRVWKVRFDALPGPDVPHVWTELPGANTFFAPSGYAMTLELGPRKEGKVTGKIYLCLREEPRTCLAGTFTMGFTRPHTERPGPDDAPSVSGDVMVTGAKPEAQVRVALAPLTPKGEDFNELAGPFDPKPVDFAQWTRDLKDRSRLVSGDGKGRPFRYEHVKLAPGRYLLSAAVIGGPAVWKWVDVPAGGTLTENFAIDATKTGGVEASVPTGVMGKVYIAPADEPGRPALDADLFQVISSQVVRQDVEIVGGKATAKNLGPGRYEVRAGELRGTVEIVTGKMAELDLTPPKK